MFDNMLLSLSLLLLSFTNRFYNLGGNQVFFFPPFFYFLQQALREESGFAFTIFQ